MMPSGGLSRALSNILLLRMLLLLWQSLLLLTMSLWLLLLLLWLLLLLLFGLLPNKYLTGRASKSPSMPTSSGRDRSKHAVKELCGILCS